MATDPSTYKLNHSMLRIKDPWRSINFYAHLGLTLIDKLPQSNFDLYFLAYDSPDATHHKIPRSAREGILELTHNHGTENDASFQANNGNSDPGKGFGHICVSVDNIQAACARLSDAGYKFQKRLEDGRMRSIAFALDPDGYWVEIIGQNSHEKTADVKETDVQKYRMNHTMLRVKSAETSLAFYQDVMGMQLLRTFENKDAGFNLYFLAYTAGKTIPTSAPNGVNPLSSQEGLLELTWNYGTEKDEKFKYHNGNDEPQGFGHICVSVDHLDNACARFEEKGVGWKKRRTEGRMKNIAFLLDPDGYWIEVIQNETLEKEGSKSHV